MSNSSFPFCWGEEADLSGFAWANFSTLSAPSLESMAHSYSSPSSVLPSASSVPVHNPHQFASSAALSTSCGAEAQRGLRLLSMQVVPKIQKKRKVKDAPKKTQRGPNRTKGLVLTPISLSNLGSLSSMKVSTLQKQLREFSASTKGSKAQLIQRLVRYMCLFNNNPEFNGNRSPAHQTFLDKDHGGHPRELDDDKDCDSHPRELDDEEDDEEEVEIEACGSTSTPPFPSSPLALSIPGQQVFTVNT